MNLEILRDKLLTVRMRFYQQTAEFLSAQAKTVMVWCRSAEIVDFHPELTLLGGCGQ